MDPITFTGIVLVALLLIIGFVFVRQLRGPAQPPADDTPVLEAKPAQGEKARGSAGTTATTARAPTKPETPLPGRQAEKPGVGE